MFFQWQVTAVAPSALFWAAHRIKSKSAFWFQLSLQTAGPFTLSLIIYYYDTHTGLWLLGLYRENVYSVFLLMTMVLQLVVNLPHICKQSNVAVPLSSVSHGLKMGGQLCSWYDISFHSWVSAIYISCRLVAVGACDDAIQVLQCVEPPEIMIPRKASILNYCELCSVLS